MKRVAVAGVGCAGLMLAGPLLAGVAVIAAVAGTGGQEGSGAPTVVEVANVTCAPGLQKPAHGWNQDQTTNAATIVRVGRSLRVPERGWLIALMTAMQESGLRNLNYGDRDSLGLFQQRPSQGWGTPNQVRDPVYSATKFYRGLLNVNGWQTMRLTQAAQAVQRSAFPEAYAKWEDDARALLAGLGTAVAEQPCSNAPKPAGPWVRPLAKYVISDTYKGGYRRTGGHSGIDLAAPAGTPILAVGAGTVSVAGWEGAYGNMVCVDHRVAVTCYAHQTTIGVAVGQAVTVGQRIGTVGATGNTTGPHLHFEVRLNSQPVDPAPWMTDRGVTL